MLLTLAAALALMQAPPAGLPSSPSEYMAAYDPVLVGAPPFRRLFLDAMVVEESDNLQRVFHSAQKYEGNPVFTKEKDWEGWGPSCGGSVVRDGDKLRMYYYCIGEDVYACVAESKDGISWTRPIVGDVEYNGSKENNIINADQFVMQLNNQPPEKKWVSFSNMRLGYSADGLHWKWDGPEKELFSSDDAMNWFFDPYRNKIYATWKCNSRRGRACGVVWTDDLKTWTKPLPGPVFGPDDLDPDASQIYAMPTFAYQGMFIGLPWFYHARWFKYGKFSANYMCEAQIGSPRNIDVQLAWSWDLINWTRTADRKPFIENSPHKTFDVGLAFTACNPIVMGDELWFYYSGWDQIHEDYDGVDCKVGLAKLRLDGFCSMRADSDEGWFISRREVFNTPKVTINAKCKSGGYIAAEIVDRNNNPIPGFEKYYSYAFTGDSVRGELTWKTKEFPAELIDKEKKIKFYIKNADLYSYLPVDINQTIDDGWPD